MATRPPPPTKAILATPLNVEESKAQRQQRSQARFRDRGGIFVPSNRNTLADILLGKAPPLTRPRKSVSASPSLRRQSKGRRSSPRKSNAAFLRRSESPVKQNRKTENSGSREVLTNVESPTEQNVAAPPAKTQKGKQPLKPKARRSSAKGSKAAEADPRDDEHESHSDIDPDLSTKIGTNPKTSKKRVSNAIETLPAARKPKPKAKSASKDAGQHTLQEMKDSTELKKAAGKRASQSSAKTKAVANKATMSTFTVSNTAKNDALKASNTPAVTSSSAEGGPSNSTRTKRRKSGDLYSCGESEDEYVPRISKKKGPAPTSSSSKTAPVKKPAAPTQGALPAIMEEDEDQDEITAHSSSNFQPSRSTLSNKRKPDAMKSSSRAKASSTERSKSSRSRAPAASDSEHDMKAKGSKSWKGSSGKRKEVASQDDKTPESVAQRSHGIKGSRASSAKSNKRQADDIDPAEEETEPPTKRPKGSGKTTSGSKTVISRKRSREHNEDEDDFAAEAKDDLAKKSAKRKKTANESDTDLPPPPKAKEGKTPVGTAPKAKKPASHESKNAKNQAKKSTKKPSQKENSSSEKASQPQAPVVKRGPPKSVLARIKASAQIHEVDNDPDEIDFLS